MVASHIRSRQAQLPDDTFDLVITSPPYDGQPKYGNGERYDREWYEGFSLNGTAEILTIGTIVERRALERDRAPAEQRARAQLAVQCPDRVERDDVRHDRTNPSRRDQLRRLPELVSRRIA